MRRNSRPPSRHVRNGILATRPGFCAYCGHQIVYVRRPGWWWQRLWWRLLGVAGAWGCSHCFRGVPLWRQKQLMAEQEFKVRQRVRRIAERYGALEKEGEAIPVQEEELDA